MRTTDRKPKTIGVADDTFLTQEKYDELAKKLDRLIKVTRPEAAREVSRLAELGDFSENVEYQLAKGRLRGINASITKIDYQLNHATVIETPKQKNTVQIGSTVSLMQNGTLKSYHILGSAETNPGKGIISHTSPLGLALLGKKLGERVTITLGTGDVEYEVVEIT